jgi:ribonuclease HI
VGEEKEVIICYTDGSCEPYNPNGIAAYAYTIDFGGGEGWKYANVWGVGEGMTSNVAEYVAVRQLLNYLLNVGDAIRHQKIMVYSDSRLVVNQLSGMWKVKGGEYLPILLDIKTLLPKFDDLTFWWVPRDLNMEADQLTRDVYEEYCRAKGIKVKYSKGRGYKARKK